MKKISILVLIFMLAGIGYAADINELTKKADGGDINAQYELGMAYMNGEGVTPDSKKAVECFEKAAGKGHSEAQYELGMAIFNGEGTEADPVKGCSWLYTTTVPAAAYGCTQLSPEERTKAINEAEKLQKSLK